MVHISDEQFEELVTAAVAAIPTRFADHLENVSFMVADEPSSDQLAKNQQLHGGMVLLGLYEGIPLPKRDSGYNMVLPDIITIFKRAHELVAVDVGSLQRQVHQTVWHEVAHYFGLDHGQIRALER